MLKIKSVKRNGYSRSQFRGLARQSCGESFEPGEEEIVFFAYDTQHNLVAVGSYVPAEPEHTPSPQSNQFNHEISYIFVKSQFKRHGYGSILLTHMEGDMMSRLRRTITLQSSSQAVGFFEKHGYSCVGEPVESTCPGSPLFARLYRMEKNIS